MPRSILHMDLDTFFVSCERLFDSRLVGKPILIGGTSDRGVVASCSYEARKMGIHAGMSMKMAKERFPEAIVIRGDSRTYTSYSKLVTEIVAEKAPVYEKASIDEFYLDFTGLDTYFGSLTYASELRNKIIKETGLPISFGLSVNKTVSKIATGEAKPNNQLMVKKGGECTFLAPLSVSKIPMVGLKTFQTLCNLGLRKIETIQRIERDMMECFLGKNGLLIWDRASGIDTSPVIPFNERKSISTETTFSNDTADIIYLHSVLLGMTEKLSYQLRKEGKLTSCIAINIRFSDFQTYTFQKKIAYTAADHQLMLFVKELFEKSFQRRMLIRLVGVRFSDLVYGNHPWTLFEDVDKYNGLYLALDKIKDRFGENAIVRAGTIINK